MKKTYSSLDSIALHNHSTMFQKQVSKRLPSIGDIYYIEATGSEKGNEQMKTRPGVLINHYAYGDMWEVALLCRGNDTRKGRSNECWFRTTASGRDSIVLLNQRKTVSAVRLKGYIASMDTDELNELRTKIIKSYLPNGKVLNLAKHRYSKKTA